MARKLKTYRTSLGSSTRRSRPLDEGGVGGMGRRPTFPPGRGQEERRSDPQSRKRAPQAGYLSFEWPDRAGLLLSPLRVACFDDVDPSDAECCADCARA